MMSAGEASGDLHGATVCRALKRLDPHLRIVGMGGSRMRVEGMEILVDPTAHAGVGTSEVLGRIPSLFRAYRLLVRRLWRDRPQALVAPQLRARSHVLPAEQEAHEVAGGDGLDLPPA